MTRLHSSRASGQLRADHQSADGAERPGRGGRGQTRGQDGDSGALTGVTLRPRHRDRVGS